MNYQAQADLSASWKHIAALGQGMHIHTQNKVILLLLP